VLAGRAADNAIVINRSVPQVASVSRLSTCLLLLAAWSPYFALSAQPSQTPQHGATAELRLAVSEFQATWQTAWFASENTRRANGDDREHRGRYLYRHCHAENFLDPQGFVAQAEAKSWGLPRPFYELIPSATTSFTVCPTWLLSPVIPFAQDESRWRDGALLSAYRARVASARRELINGLARAVTPDGDDAWVRGQLTRFLIDAGDLNGALTVATGCSHPSWWCAGLKGLIYHMRGEGANADSAFAQLRAVMSDAALCRWDDVSLLLDDEDRERYRALDCNGRRRFQERMWWLADPLFRTPGNERRSEQEARRMTYAIRSAVLQDERYPYDPERGGDAIATMLERYGWPVYTSWGGTLQDRSHSDYLARKASRTPSAAPYTTFEYTLDAVSTIPSWRTIESPFTARGPDWLLHPADSMDRPSDSWWPREHFRPIQRLVDLPPAQQVFVRRHNQVEVAMALPLSHSALRGAGGLFDVMLLSTAAPGRIDSLASAKVADGSNAFLRGVIASGASLLAIEALGVEGGIMINARMRHGAIAPEPLAALGAFDIDLSDVALLSSLPDSALRTPRDELLQHMLPCRCLRERKRQLVLYWEVYGVRPADSATMSIAIASEREAGLLRRLGVMTGVASDPRRSVAMSWQDGEPIGGLANLQGPVPVQVRTLQMDFSSLEPGSYVVDVTVRLADGRTASRRTSVTLEP
jgi:hypothetical protein